VQWIVLKWHIFKKKGLLKSLPSCKYVNPLQRSYLKLIGSVHIFSHEISSTTCGMTERQGSTHSVLTLCQPSTKRSLAAFNIVY